MWKKLFIAGGGLAGVSLAHLSQKQFENILLFEKNDRVGGRIQTQHVGGGFVEAGAQFFTKDDSNIQKISKSAGMSKKICEFPLKEFSILHNTEKTPIKESLTNKIDDEELTEVSSFAKNITNKKWLANLSPELTQVNFRTWYIKKFGKKSIPIIDSLTRSITFSESKNLNAYYGTLVCSAFFNKTYTFKQGLQQLIVTLQNKTKKVSKQLKTELTDINLQKNKITSIIVQRENGKKEKLPLGPRDWFASALPANKLAPIIEDNEARALLKKFKYINCAVAFFKTRKKALGQEKGIICEADCTIAAILETPYTRGTQKEWVVTAILPLAEAHSAEKLIQKTKNELSQLFPALDKTLTFEQIQYWNEGLTECSTQFTKIQNKISKIHFKNFLICGDFMSLPSMDGAVESAYNAARQILQK